MGGIVRALAGKVQSTLIVYLGRKDLIPLNLGLVKFLFLIKITTYNFLYVVISFNKNAIESLIFWGYNFLQKENHERTVILKQDIKLVTLYAFFVSCTVYFLTQNAFLVSYLVKFLTQNAFLVSYNAIFLTQNAFSITFIADFLTQNAFSVTFFAFIPLKNAFLDQKLPVSYRINTYSPSFSHFSSFPNLIGVVQ
jgi:hypothetical protein